MWKFNNAIPEASFRFGTTENIPLIIISYSIQFNPNQNHKENKNHPELQ